MSDVDKLKRSLLKKRELFEDPDFPANQSSVFYHQTPPFEFVWKRPQDLNFNPSFILDGSTQQFDITSGKLGDKWLVSCMGCLTLNRGLFYRVVPADQSFQDDYCGLFRFRVWWCGEWQEVVVDDRLPTVNNKLVFIHFQHSNQYWASLLEKAYAKLHGSYEALKYGSTQDGLSDFTGGIVETIDLRHDSNSCSHLLNRLLSMTSVVTCLVEQTQTRVQPEKLANGIHLAMNYQLLSMEKVDVSGSSSDQVQLVRLRNPIGTSEYVGNWCRGSPDWKRVSSKDKEQLNYYSCPDSEFWMPYNEFVKTFTTFEVVHLDGETSQDEPSLRHKKCWQMKLWQGSWIKGVTAGGCRNNIDTFHINPQYQLILPDVDEVMITINQHSVIEPKVIGFSCYQMPKGGTDRLGKAFFKKQKSFVNSPYTNNRQVTQRCHFESGGYVIMPTTFEPGEESNFTIRVYSTNTIKLKLVDCLPSVIKPAIIKAPHSVNGSGLKNYETVFLQASNEHKTINAFELQELLEACLPNDYVKSCANLEVCRQIVLALDDSTGTGRIGVAAFNNLMYSLKYWQSIFCNCTKRTTGILKAEKLRDALNDIGNVCSKNQPLIGSLPVVIATRRNVNSRFQLNSDTLCCLILRYMRKDGTLRFGDFVSCILHLTVAFSNFEKKDPLQNGYIKLVLADWLKLSLRC